MSQPARVQRERTKGWRMPPGAVYVGRPTVFGNPWTVADAASNGVAPEDRARWAVARYALAGKDLACWCPLESPCHADVLLAVANP